MSDAGLNNFAPVPPSQFPICVCFDVMEETIEQAIREKSLTTVEQIMANTNAGCGCHSCHPELEDILARCLKGQYRFPPNVMAQKIKD